jgi:hypothetical protein
VLNDFLSLWSIYLSIFKPFILRKILFLFSILTIFGCQSDDDNDPVAPDYSFFLDDDTPRITGKFGDEDFVWNSGFVGAYGVAYSYNGLNGDSNSPERILKFGLLKQFSTNYFFIWTPRYNITSEMEFNQVFGLGKKPIGNSESNFYLEINYEGIDYISCEAMSNSTVEILKTEEGVHVGSEVLKVWFKMDDMDFTACNGAMNFRMNEAYVMAYFWGHKFD